MTIDASDVGLHCSVCNVLDFLPFRCAYCDATFCKIHASQAPPDAHKCPNAASSNSITHSGEGNPPSGTFLEFLPDRSEAQFKGQAEAVSAKAASRQAALDVLHRNFPKTAVTKSASNSANSIDITQHTAIPKSVMAMKLKAKAKPADPNSKKTVAALDKRYLAVAVEGTAHGIDLWLNKSMHCGRALDLFCMALKVTNHNDQAGTRPVQRLYLAKFAKTGPCPLDNTATIGSMTEDGDMVYIMRSMQ